MLKNAKLTNIQQHNNEYLQTIVGTDITEKINAHLNVRDKVFVNRNMPTMTLDEFAEKQIVLMEEDKRKQKEFEEANKIAYEDEDKDKVVDDKTRADREWDDWKDLHEKGSGNKGYTR